jgi:starch synthase (maltosyl-transferring)
MAKVVCVSNSVKQWCISAERVLPAKLEVIPNGIEIATKPAAIQLSEFGIAENARILLFVGRLTVQKGVDELLDRVPKLLAKLPNHQLVLLGDGPLRARADATSELPEIKGRMKVLGQSDEVRAWMGRSEILLLPTRYEGMPNVVLEAMGEGLPVVTTRVEGVVDLLGDAQEMQAVEAGDWDRWLDQVVHVANDPGLRDGLGRFNRARAETEFCLETQMEKYESLYQHVLETCRSGRM